MFIAAPAKNSEGFVAYGFVIGITPEKTTSDRPLTEFAAEILGCFCKNLNGSVSGTENEIALRLVLTKFYTRTAMVFIGNIIGAPH